MEFNTFEELSNYVQNTLGVKLRCYIRGLNYFKKDKIMILRSVDNTFYYKDDFTKENIEYTLEGKSGNQDLNSGLNSTLLNEAENMYLYRKSHKKYIWYGEVHILNINDCIHEGEDGIQRIIYVLTLFQ